MATRLIGHAEARGESLRIECDQLAFGSDDAPIRLRGQPFELLRAIAGRRSVAQIKALDWVGDSSRVIQEFWWPPLTPAACDIHE